MSATPGPSTVHPGSRTHAIFVTLRTTWYYRPMQGIGTEGIGGTDFLLQPKPLIMSLHQFFDDILFNFFLWILLQVNVYP